MVPIPDIIMESVGPAFRVMPDDTRQHFGVFFEVVRNDRVEMTSLGMLDTGSGVKNVEVNMKKHRSSVITSDIGVMSIQMSFFCILILAILKLI